MDRFISTTSHKCNDSIKSTDSKCTNYHAPKISRFEYSSENVGNTAATIITNDKKNREQDYNFLDRQKLKKPETSLESQIIN